MISIATLLDRAKAAGHIDTDYRLAKILSINQSALGNYRAGRSLPNEKILSQLCALSGDDPGVMAAEIQAERAKSDEGKSLWLAIAARLASDRRALVRGATSAILSVLFTIGLIAAPADSARAGGLDSQQKPSVNFLYIVSGAFLTVSDFIERRSWRISLFLRLCFARVWF